MHSGSNSSGHSPNQGTNSSRTSSRQIASNATSDSSIGVATDRSKSEVIQAITLAVVVADHFGTIADVNESALSLFGYKRDEMLGKNVRMLMPISVANKHDGFLDMYRKTGRTSLINSPRDVLIRRSDGTSVHVELCLGRNVMDGKELLAATFHEYSKSPNTSGMKLPSTQVSQAVVVCNRQMKITSFSSGAEMLFGWSKSEVVGKDVSMLMPSPYKEKHDQYVHRYVTTGTRKLLGIPRELLAARKDGRIVAVELSLAESGEDEEGSAYVASFKVLESRHAHTAGAGNGMSTGTGKAHNSIQQKQTEIVKPHFVSRYETEYQEMFRLGSGGFGAVFLVRHVINQVKLGYYAVKKVPVGDRSAWLQAMLREVRMHESLHHNNVVSYKHSWVEYHKMQEQEPESLFLFILMDFCNGGNLASYLGIYYDEPTPEEKAELERNRAALHNDNVNDGNDAAAVIGKKRTRPKKRFKQFLDEAHVWQLFFDVCAGLQYLHRNGVLHRDLKPENILLHTEFNSTTRQEESRALISDFGTSSWENKSQFNRTGCTGTLGYIAPELLKVDKDGKPIGQHSSKCDMWSLGLVLYALCFSRVPFNPGTPDQYILDTLMDSAPLKFPEHPKRSPVLLDVLGKLLQKNPEKRIDIEGLLSNSVLARIYSEMRRGTVSGSQPSKRQRSANSARPLSNNVQQLAHSGLRVAANSGSSLKSTVQAEVMDVSPGHSSTKGDRSMGDNSDKESSIPMDFSSHLNSNPLMSTSSTRNSNGESSGGAIVEEPDFDNALSGLRTVQMYTRTGLTAPLPPSEAFYTNTALTGGRRNSSGSRLSSEESGNMPHLSQSIHPQDLNGNGSLARSANPRHGVLLTLSILLIQLYTLQHSCNSGGLSSTQLILVSALALASLVIQVLDVLSLASRTGDVTIYQPSSVSKALALLQAGWPVLPLAVMQSCSQVPIFNSIPSITFLGLTCCACALAVLYVHFHCFQMHERKCKTK